jgi:hypothetical protein
MSPEENNYMLKQLKNLPLKEAEYKPPAQEDPLAVTLRECFH